MKKVKLFTHTDLDGVGCAVLVQLAFNDFEIEYCDHNEINDEVWNFIQNNNPNEYDFCFITDISVNDEIAKYINEHKLNFYLLDHHATALELNKYSWCNVIIEDEKTSLKTCGTELLYNFLVKEKSFLPYMDNALHNFVEIVRDYDTWRWASLGTLGFICKRINDLFSLYGREKFIFWCIDEITKGEFPKFNETEKILLSNRQKEINEYIEEKNKQLKVIDLFNKNCGVVFAERFFSELGNKLCVLHPEIEFIAMINLGEKTIQFRSIKEDVDVGKIAKFFGGGGHPKSSGTTFTDDVTSALINDIFCKDWITDRTPSKEECDGGCMKEFLVVNTLGQIKSMHYCYRIARGKEISRWEYNGRIYNSSNIVAWRHYPKLLNRKVLHKYEQKH